jgi:hypothetical protein
MKNTEKLQEQLAEAGQKISTPETKTFWEKLGDQIRSVKASVDARIEKNMREGIGQENTKPISEQVNEPTQEPEKPDEKGGALVHIPRGQSSVVAQNQQSSDIVHLPRAEMGIEAYQPQPENQIIDAEIVSEEVISSTPAETNETQKPQSRLDKLRLGVAGFRKDLAKQYETVKSDIKNQTIEENAQRVKKGIEEYNKNNPTKEPLIINKDAEQQISINAISEESRKNTPHQALKNLRAGLGAGNLAVAMGQEKLSEKSAEAKGVISEVRENIQNAGLELNANIQKAKENIGATAFETREKIGRAFQRLRERSGQALKNTWLEMRFAKLNLEARIDSGVKGVAEKVANHIDSKYTSQPQLRPVG